MSCCTYHAGMLTERVVIERRVSAADGIGGTVDTWAGIPATPQGAMLRPLTGTEAVVAQRLAPTANYRAILRFRPDANGNPYYRPSDRLVHRARYFSILCVFDWQMKHRWIELLLQEGRPS